MGDDDAAAHRHFCGNIDACGHVLLVVNKTFRTAEGGTSMDIFSSHWAALFGDIDDNFEERELFDSLLEEVALLSDAMKDRDHEGGQYTFGVRDLPSGNRGQGKGRVEGLQPRRRVMLLISTKVACAISPKGN
jgi:hypothetical protein